MRDRQQAGASRAPPTLEERRAAFAPAGRLHPVPADELVREVTAGGVPARWLAAPGADTGRVLLFLHGGGYELGSLRRDGELAARLGRASEMRVLFPEYRLAPRASLSAAVDDVLAAWRWLRTGQGLSARSTAGGGDSAATRRDGRRHGTSAGLLFIYGGRRLSSPALRHNMADLTHAVRITERSAKKASTSPAPARARPE